MAYLFNKISPNTQYNTNGLGAPAYPTGVYVSKTGSSFALGESGVHVDYRKTGGSGNSIIAVDVDLQLLTPASGVNLYSFVSLQKASGNLTGQICGNFNAEQTANTCSGSITGVVGNATASGSGASPTLIGVSAQVGHTSSGAVTTAKELELSSFCNKTLTNWYGIHVNAVPFGTTPASLTNMYGIFIDSARDAWGTNKYAIYSQSVNTSKFFGNIELADKNLVFGTTTGTKIGTATTQKIGFWNVTPIVQPTTAGASATFVANAGTAVNTLSTFDGYKIDQVVKALRNVGILA